MSLNLILFIVIPFLVSGFAAWGLENLWGRKLKAVKLAKAKETEDADDLVDKAMGGRAQRAQARKEEFSSCDEEGHLDLEPALDTAAAPATVSARARSTPRAHRKSHATAPVSNSGDMADFVIPDDFNLREFSGRQSD